MASKRKKGTTKKKPKKRVTKKQDLPEIKMKKEETTEKGVEEVSQKKEEKVSKKKTPLRPPLAQKTAFLKKEDILHRWYLIDASGKKLGRLCTSIATLLSGKNRPDYTKHCAPGDFVVVINAEKISVSGKKLDKKKYYWHTGYLGGIKEITLKRLLETHPERVIFKAVKGMLPNNHVGRVWLSRLKVYSGQKHPHEAQKPELLTI